MIRIKTNTTIFRLEDMGYGRDTAGEPPICLPPLRLTVRKG